MIQPDLKLVRIDERLIHGQGQLWIRSLGVNLCVVANDDTASDPLQQTLMKSVAKNVGMRFFTIDKTIEIIHRAAPTQHIFLVVKNPQDALWLVKGGVPITNINVGNIHSAEGKHKISNYIYLGEEDKQALKELHEKYNVTFDTRTSPMAPDVDSLNKLMDYITK
ncbi:PTS sugar transporter subunit IIB [Jeotgalibaca ciconiae]|uniref:PTS mannose/fructose/sorbose transporter subunit IIB n=1 Tax=Jeotgalibaca ciconiae TaxID=2496265 RepID=A0A3Q9BM27_9LACT|nr:PTS sugar transporter subunit IIB [Jeotgalibaca ciconiae]AZP05590.1 PTS mannose/fructose/sorbose transporter subunit IIB [Jeotgalibaca ciconiae]